MVSNRNLGGINKMKYWFLYNLSDGTIYGAPYYGDVDEWTNIPEGCGVIGGLDESDIVKDAFTNPSKYKVVNGELTLIGTTDTSTATSSDTTTTTS
jgi:hypothetical protein